MTTSQRFPWWMTLALCGAGALVLAVFLAPRRGLEVAPRAPGDTNVLRVAFTQALQPDPHRRSFPLPTQSQFILCLWEPLVACDPGTGQPQPAAAQGWKWSEDRLTLTISLRPDGRWSNGDPVTAQDFIRSWRRLLRQDSELAVTLFPVRNAAAFHRGELKDPAALGLEAVDDFTLRIRLAGVRATFVAELADPLLAPLHRTTEAVLREKRFFDNPRALVTNGPFELERADGEGFRLKACAYYRGRASVSLTGIHFLRADGPRMARLLLAAGRVDMMIPAMVGGPVVLPTDRRVTEVSEMDMVVTALDLNVTRGPLRDVRVRRALSLASDRAGSIRESDRERRVPAYAWVPDMPGRPGLDILKEDAAEARRLLAEAGYPGGRGFPILILPVSWRDQNYAYLQAWTERWYRELGVRTYLSYQTETGIKELKRTGDYDVFINGLLATVPDAGDMLGSFGQPEVYSASRWEDAGVKSLLAGLNNLTGLERLARLEEIERKVMDAVPTIPMMFERRRTLLAVEVEGWYAEPLGRQMLSRLSLRPVPHQGMKRGGLL